MRQCQRKVACGRRVTNAIRSLVNARDLQLVFAKVLHETLLVLVLMYGSKTILWKEKERSRIRAVLMDNLRDLLGIRRIDRILNAEIRELCRVSKWVNERIDEGVLWFFSSVERMENDRIAKRVYVGETAGSHLVDRSQKRWIDAVKDCLRKRGLDIK